jgi:cytochrome c biogenesis protein CcdA
MGGKNLYEQVMVIFGGVMVFFYFGMGIFIIISPYFEQIEKFLRIIFGSALGLLGIQRAVQTYEKVKEVFFTKNNSDE